MMSNQHPSLWPRSLAALAVLAGLLWGGQAAAQTADPRVPTLTCTTDPAIINTAIAPDASGGYSSSSGRLTSGNDPHWDYAAVSNLKCNTAG